MRWTSRAHVCIVVCALVAAAVTAAPAHAGSGPVPIRDAWVQLGPGGAPIARAILSPVASNCPAVVVVRHRRGQPLPMRARATPTPSFPDIVCEATLPRDARSARIQNRRLPLPLDRDPDRIVLFGDTGCMLEEGAPPQACRDPAAWPFARMAAAAARARPDLVVHLGDLLYREEPCPPGAAGCRGSPSGFNAAANRADFFTPAASLLRAAPWVFVRGNHEQCTGNATAWFRYWDPRPAPRTCPNFTAPYAVPIGDRRLVVTDTSVADQTSADPAQVAAYRAQLAAIDRLDAGGGWLLTHRPIWGVGVIPGTMTLFTGNPTLEAAWGERLPASVSHVLSGHQHLFELLLWGRTPAGPAPRPAQVIAGNGGTSLDAPPGRRITGLDVQGREIRDARVRVRHGWIELTRGRRAWRMAVRDPGGAAILTCTLQGRGADCTGVAD